MLERLGQTCRILVARLRAYGNGALMLSSEGLYRDSFFQEFTATVSNLTEFVTQIVRFYIDTLSRHDHTRFATVMIVEHWDC
jgi:hypothetical protein